MDREEDMSLFFCKWMYLFRFKIKSFVIPKFERKEATFVSNFMIRQKKRQKMNLKSIYAHKRFDPKYDVFANESP